MCVSWLYIYYIYIYICVYALLYPLIYSIHIKIRASKPKYRNMCSKHDRINIINGPLCNSLFAMFLIKGANVRRKGIKV